ncbi:MAG: hypothetical protein EP338_03700 [Bacteroidetes bacterium]|nr:MAG: hypothetical protein EP338_03700 [Bacteroidota bacterium]
MSQRRAFFIGFLFLVFQLQGQEALIHSFKLEKNKLFFKWVPTDASTFREMLTQETEVAWIQVDRKKDNDLIDFSKATIEKREALANRIDELYREDTSLIIFAENILNQKTKQDSAGEVGDIPFVNALVQNFLDSKIAGLTGNVLIIPKINAKKDLAIRVRNKGFDKDYIFWVNPRSYSLNEIPAEIFLDERKVNLTWNVKDLNEDFFAYNIYRKGPGEKSFVKMNERPKVPFEAKDDLTPEIRRFLDAKVEKGNAYEYMLRGIDYFGDETGESKTKKIYIPLYVDAEALIDTIRAEGLERFVEVKISPTDQTMKPSFDRLLLMRSDSLLFGYETIETVRLLPSAESYQFKLGGIETGEAYYYKTVLLSKDNDSVESIPYYFFTLDQRAPEIATNLMGKVDSTGIVKLAWTAPPDKDVSGYRVFRANALNEEFQEITKVLKKGSSYQDTLSLNTLTNEVYYYVVAVDHNFNNSPNSDTVLLMKPDTIPPVASVFKKYKSKNEGVYMKWYNSTSQDLLQQYLIRYVDRQGSRISDTIYRWSDTTSQIVDKQVNPGYRYEYEILSLDKSKNQSKSTRLQVFFETGYRQAIESLEARANRENKSIELRWSYSDSANVYSYQIFKAREDGSFYSFKTIINKPGLELFVEDRQLKINNRYRYKIKAVLKSGIPTALSEEVVVVY